VIDPGLPQQLRAEDFFFIYVCDYLLCQEKRDIFVDKITMGLKE
jgi:hypothetical protein